MVKELGRALVLLLILSVAVVGCGQKEPTAPTTPTTPTPQEPTSGGTVTYGLAGDPERLHPLVWPRFTGAQIFPLVFGGLVRANERLEYEPYLAREWVISEDNRTVTFHLRDDVLWHDGVPFTAHDVAFSLNAIAHPDHPGGVAATVDLIVGLAEVKSGEAKELTGINVINDHTIAITWATPYAMYLARMSFHIVPKHVLEAYPVADWERIEFNQKPVGVGPFRVVEYRPDEYVRLEAFDDHFAGRPQFDELIFRIGAPSTLIAAFISQEIDIVQVPIEELGAVEHLPHAYIREHPGSRYIYIAFNYLNEKFTDPVVRRAIWYAVNRQQIVDSLLMGHGAPVYCTTAPDRWEYNPAMETSFDPQMAARMLDEGGWTVNPDTKIREKDGIQLKFEMWYPLDREGVIPYAAAVVQQNLKQINVEMMLRTVDSPSLWTQLFPRDAENKARAVRADEFDTIMVSLGGVSDPGTLISEFHSGRIVGRGNYTGYSNEEADRLLDLQAVEMDPRERARIFHEFFQVVAEDPPRIPLVVPNLIYACNTRVSGFNPVADAVLWWNDVLEWTVVK